VFEGSSDFSMKSLGASTHRHRDARRGVEPIRIGFGPRANWPESEPHWPAPPADAA
jgi:catalase (peroxidase I)